MIQMEDISKSYKVAKRNGGFKEACRTLFRREYETIRALDHISFTIKCLLISYSFRGVPSEDSTHTKGDTYKILPCVVQ